MAALAIGAQFWPTFCRLKLSVNGTPVLFSLRSFLTIAELLRTASNGYGHCVSSGINVQAPTLDAVVVVPVVVVPLALAAAAVLALLAEVPELALAVSAALEPVAALSELPPHPMR